MTTRAPKDRPTNNCEKWDLLDQVDGFIDPGVPIYSCATFQPNFALLFTYMGPLGWIDWINLWRAIKRGGVARFSLWILTAYELLVFEIDGGIFKRDIKQLIGRWPLEEVSAVRIAPRSPLQSHTRIAMIVDTPTQHFEVKAEVFDEAAEDVIFHLCQKGD